MFEFFIALFGGLFYGGQKLKDRNAQKQFDNVITNIRNVDKLIDGSSERMALVRAFLNYDKCWELLYSISDELEEVFGVEWEKEFCNGVDIIKDSEPYSPSSVATNILLSKKGKVNMCWSSGWIGSSPSGLDKQCVIIINTCRIVEQNIQKFHPDMKMLFVPFSPEYVRTGYSLDNLPLGSIEWAYKIPQAHLEYSISLW